MLGGKAAPPALCASIQIMFLFTHQNVSAELSKPTTQAESRLRFYRFLMSLELCWPTTTQRNALNTAQNVGLVRTSEGLLCSLPYRLVSVASSQQTSGVLVDASGCH